MAFICNPLSSYRCVPLPRLLKHRRCQQKRSGASLNLPWPVAGGQQYYPRAPAAQLKYRLPVSLHANGNQLWGRLILAVASTTLGGDVNPVPAKILCAPSSLQPNSQLLIPTHSASNEGCGARQGNIMCPLNFQTLGGRSLARNSCLLNLQ